MTTKVEELVAWCRRDTNAGCKVIPAPSTKERNDLADLVAQRTDVELRDVWRALETQQEKMVFLWLVTTVTGFETASHIIAEVLIALNEAIQFFTGREDDFLQYLKDKYGLEEEEAESAC